ncbi:hypothetical protein Q9L42_019310 [Methylomarinum sp. Ch1-1]|uniref:Prepilin-type N-terminal cleavage/methylation domain-containing protein n=1 Tax=Methylomarinum roseum TaxID=3067653 RepID=A0AAU7NU26_9GAMM|nr:hypothetical protein [Methylomarinum sp. Ch1-1]MDP4519459.1 hypothetical protein [Methylomarinum sp. Ch1-1]
MKHYNNMARQAGMTLIELTVVLLVLIGLAGLMIPYVSGFVSKTHDSTGTNNLAALNGTIQRFHTQFNSLPDDLHSLIETSTGTNPGTVYSELMNPNMLSPVTYTEDGTTGMVATEIPLMSLTSAGITSVYDMKDPTTNGSKTFDAGNAPVTVPMPSAGNAAAVTLAALNSGDRADIETHLATAFGRQATNFNSTCYDYIVMGVGQESEMTGRAIQEAPVHFAQNGDMGPDKRYNRFVSVFQVDKDNSTAGCSTNTEQAKFIGTAMIMMPNHIIGLAEEMDAAYANIAAK